MQESSTADDKNVSEWDMPDPKAEDSDSDDENEGNYSPVLDQVCTHGLYRECT